MYDLTTALEVVSRDVMRIKPVNRTAVTRAFEDIEASIERSFSLEDLERVRRHDRRSHNPGVLEQCGAVRAKCRVGAIAPPGRRERYDRC